MREHPEPVVPLPVQRVRNDVASGAHADALVQAGVIHGDIALHGGSRTRETAPIPKQLPAPPRNFVGRKAELRILDRLVSESTSTGSVMVAVIDGTAGVGKTSMAVHWAHRMQESFPDGQFYVDLLGYGPTGAPMVASDVLHGFLHALNVSHEDIPEHEHVKSALFRSLVAQKRMLLILDNAFSANQVRGLLPGTSSCFTLVTSRRKLQGLFVEHDAMPITLSVLTRATALEMLSRRVGSKRVRKEVEAAEALLDLCAGLPLALGMLSARLRMQPTLSLSVLLDDIGSRASPLEGFSSKDTRDVRTVSSWSYDALSAESARMFRLLSLQPGTDIGLHAAASLAGVPLNTARDALAELVASNMLEQPSTQRYKFHALLLDYAKEKVTEEEPELGRQDAVSRFLDFLMHTAKYADVKLHPHRHAIDFNPPLPGVVPYTVATYDEAMRWFDQERLTLVAAVLLAAREERWESAWKIAWACSTYFDRRGRWQDWATTQEVALTAAHAISDGDAEARTERILANIYSHLQDFPKAKAHGEAAMRIFHERDDTIGEARIFRTMSAIHAGLGESDVALQYAEKALRLYRSLGDEYGQANTLCAISAAEHSRGDHGPAAEHADEALSLYMHTGDKYGQAQSLRRIADAQGGLGDIDSDIDNRLAAVRAYQDLKNPTLVGQALYELSRSYRRIGDYDSARRTLQEVLLIARAEGSINTGTLEVELAELE